MQVEIRAAGIRAVVASVKCITQYFIPAVGNQPLEGRISTKPIPPVLITAEIRACIEIAKCAQIGPKFINQGTNGVGVIDRRGAYCERITRVHREPSGGLK